MIAGGYGQILILLSAKPNPSYAQLSTEIIAVPLPPVLCVRQMMCLFDNTIFLIQNKARSTRVVKLKEPLSVFSFPPTELREQLKQTKYLQVQ